MVLDSSALCAILFNEPGGDELIAKISRSARRLISTGTLLEASIVIEARRGELVASQLDVFLRRAGVEIVPVDTEQVELARAGWRRFGKGRHAAGLNFGDLFAYALARRTQEPLLFVGDDLAATDVARA